MTAFSRGSKIVKSFQKAELHKHLFNFILKHQSIQKKIKLFCFSKEKITSSPTRIVNRCRFSQRSKSVYKFAFLSRHFLRKHSFFQQLPGLRKSYW